jgi:hypothetical protein
VAARSRLGAAALGFALAACLSAWNPIAAPFGLVVGASAAILAAITLRRRAEGRLLARLGLALGLLAVVASALVLGLTAGVGRDPAGEPIVPARSAAEVRRELDAAAARTRAVRERARGELSSLGEDGGKEGAAGAPPPPPPNKGGKPLAP